MKRFLRILFWLFIILNVIVVFHAWKFTHFYPAGQFRYRTPEQMNAWEKTRMIFFGVRLSKAVDKGVPDTAYQTVMLHTKDGLRLEAWYMQVANPRGTVLLFHGYNGCKSSQLGEAKLFRSFGYNVLMTDFRASGNSEGYTCSIGYKEAIDVQTAYDYIRGQGEQHIILYGFSMGAAAVLRAVPLYHLQPEKLILESSFATLTDAVKSRMRAVHVPPTPFSQLLAFWGGVEQGFWGPGFKPVVSATHITIPTLVDWGALDIRVTRKETEDIYNALATKEKKLVIYDHAGHQSLSANEPDKWIKNVTEFLK
jgi:uncharacterized protein